MKNKEKAYGSIDKLVEDAEKEIEDKGLDKIIDVSVEGKTKQYYVVGKGIVVEETYTIGTTYKQENNKTKYLPILKGIIIREYDAEDKEELRNEDLLNESILYIRGKLKQKFIHPNYLKCRNIDEVYSKAKKEIKKKLANSKNIHVKVIAKSKSQKGSDGSVGVDRLYEIETIGLSSLYFKVHARYDNIKEFSKEEPDILNGNRKYLENKFKG